MLLSITLPRSPEETRGPLCILGFFFNDTATTEIYTLSLHDALPISRRRAACRLRERTWVVTPVCRHGRKYRGSRRLSRQRRAGGGENARHDVLLLRTQRSRSEEHTSELQSLRHL